MLRVLLALLAVGVTVYALIDCLRSDDDEVNLLPHPVWVLITLVPLLGGVAWLVFGRNRFVPGAERGYRVPAPDDDPEFLGSLDRGVRERRRRDAEDRRRRRREQAQDLPGDDVRPNRRPDGDDRTS